MVARPQIDATFVSLSTADREGMNIEQRTDRAEGEAAQLHLWPLAPQEISQQRGDQRTMHDQARVTLDPCDIAAVIVDAMAIEGQCRIPEQKHRVRNDAAREALATRGRNRLGGRRIAWRIVAENDVVLLEDGETLCVRDLVSHAHENQRTAAPFLTADIFNARCAPDFLTNVQR